jgi:hypothetical protein
MNKAQENRTPKDSTRRQQLLEQFKVHCRCQCLFDGEEYEEVIMVRGLRESRPQREGNKKLLKLPGQS